MVYIHHTLALQDYFDDKKDPESLGEHEKGSMVEQRVRKKSALLEFRLKGCFRVLQAEVWEPNVALTRSL